MHVLIYVADKRGTGAETTLHLDGEVVFRHTLAPGDLIIFRDDTYLHSASPLINPVRRDGAARCGGLYGQLSGHVRPELS